MVKDLPRPAPDRSTDPSRLSQRWDPRPSSTPTYGNPIQRSARPLQPRPRPYRVLRNPWARREARVPVAVCRRARGRRGGLPEQAGKGDPSRPPDYRTELPEERSRPETTLHMPTHQPLGVRPHRFPGRPLLALGPPSPRPAATWLTRCALRGSQLSR